MDKLVAIENSIENFREKIRNFTPAPSMIGHNCKKMRPLVTSISSAMEEDEDDEQEDEDSPSQLNEGMIEDQSGDQSEELEADGMFGMDEVSSEGAGDS